MVGIGRSIGGSIDWLGGLRVSCHRLYPRFTSRRMKSRSRAMYVTSKMYPAARYRVRHTAQSIHDGLVCWITTGRTKEPYTKINYTHKTHKYTYHNIVTVARQAFAPERFHSSRAVPATQPATHNV